MPHRHPIFVLTVAALIGLCFGATPSAAQTDVIGQWSLVNPLPFFPVHTHLLPTGKVMIWPGDEDGGGAPGNDPRSWDPANQSVSILSKPGYNIFCSGHSFLADGTLFVAGGHIATNVGLRRASIYNPFTNTWNTTLPDMNAGRWYPTTTVLANGDVLTIAGDIDTVVGHNLVPQVFQVSTGTWRTLTDAQLDLEDYPRMLLAPNGKVFNAAASTTTRYLDTSGSGAWSFVADRVGGYRDYGSAVMYAPGKVLVMGGGQDPPAETAEVIDLNAALPSWRPVGSMRFARRHLNATLLPDGTVLVTGGYNGPDFGFRDTSPTSSAVYEAELWDPATENWTTLARSLGIPRVYHSAALLLPDGRVLSTGGNGHPETETYSPPYLFKGTRPTITSAPPSVAYGQSFFVGTPDALTISKITMLRLSSVTHAFNQSQYINELSFSQTSGGLNVLAPPGPATPGAVAPPGYYLLFLLNGSGVPSVAQIIQVHDALPPPDGLSDVIVTSLSYASGVFTSTVTNQGPAATPAGIGIGVGYSVDGVFRTFGAVANPPLAAGQSATVGTNGGPDTVIPTGTHTITAFVDNVNRFVESDETNNQLSQSITVGGTDTQAPPTCRGRVANIWVSNNTIFGGPDSGRPYTRTLRGTNGKDVIVGTDANDSINGAGGNDIICGGAGRDTLRGAQGRDQLFGERGRDRLFGGSGRDLCNGGQGRDTVSSCERLK